MNNSVAVRNDRQPDIQPYCSKMEKFTFTQFKFDKVNSVENESEILKQLNRSSSEEEIIDYEVY